MLKNFLFTALIFNSLSVCAADYVANSDITGQVNSEIKKAKPGNTIKIPAGTYKINAEQSVILRDNINLTLSPQTTLIVIPSKKGRYQAFRIHNVKNVKITGGTLIGDRYNHLGKTGEWGMGIDIKDSQNVIVSNMNINKMWGDAIYIGTNGKNSNYNIKLSNISMNDNRRQGISIVSVNTLNANNIKVSNTHGTNPASGIDIEPYPGMVIKNVKLQDIFTSNNQGPGIQIGLGRHRNLNQPVSITIENHTDTGSQYGFLMGRIPHEAFGNIHIISPNYAQSRITSCFYPWRNINFNVRIKGGLVSSVAKKCRSHLANPSIALIK